MSEFNMFVKSRAKTLGRSEASVRAKLRELGITKNDTPDERDLKIVDYVVKKLLC